MLKWFMDHPNIGAVLFYLVFAATVGYFIRRMYKDTAKQSGES